MTGLLDVIIESREKLTHSYSHFLPPNTLKFLCSLHNNTKSFDPLSSILFLRSISHLWLAGLLQCLALILLDLLVFVDELVKPVITMPTVLRDPGELIRCLEQLEIPANCLLVTADVSSLYPNIDTKKAIVALDLLL